MNRLFRPFSQADASTHRRYGGTGLGLVIVQRIAQAMGGDAWATSQQGEGSQFFATMALEKDASSSSRKLLTGLRVFVSSTSDALSSGPLARHLQALGATVSGPETADVALVEGPCPPPDLAAPIVAVGPPGIREHSVYALAQPFRRAELAAAVLDAVYPEQRRESRAAAGIAQPTHSGLSVQVAEDHPVNQKVMMHMLSRLGHAVTMAQDGAEAIERASSTQFDLILMDMQMPGVDGLQATRAIRRHQATSLTTPTPIWALTANASAEDRAECKSAGMTDYLTKPLRIEDLSRRLSKLISDRSA